MTNKDIIKFQKYRTFIHNWIRKNKSYFKKQNYHCIQEQGQDDGFGPWHVLHIISYQKEMEAVVSLQVPQFASFAYVQIEVIQYAQGRIRDKIFYWNDKNHEVPIEEIAHQLEVMKRML